VDARADAIISDTFTASDGTTLDDSHKPDTNLTGGAYGNVVNAPSIQIPVIESGKAKLSRLMGVGIPINSTESYTKPTEITISATLNLANLMGAGSPTENYYEGIGLGFYENVNNADASQSYQAFRGLELFIDGSLGLVNTNGGPPGSLTPYQGTWDQSADHTLSYSVSTTTGEIFNVSLDGHAYTFETVLFKDIWFIPTNNAGFFVATGPPGSFGTVDNFQVLAVP
jgi:hypothetical protein